MTVWQLSRVHVAAQSVRSCSDGAGMLPVPEMLIQSARMELGR